MKTQIILLASTLMMVMAQNRNFYACSKANNTYCANGGCYNSISSRPGNNVTGICSKDFAKDAYNLVFPVT